MRELEKQSLSVKHLFASVGDISVKGFIYFLPSKISFF